LRHRCNGQRGLIRFHNSHASRAPFQSSP
jgi:hypothetical protein